MRRLAIVGIVLVASATLLAGEDAVPPADATKDTPVKVVFLGFVVTRPEEAADKDSSDRSPMTLFFAATKQGWIPGPTRLAAQYLRDVTFRDNLGTDLTKPPADRTENEDFEEGCGIGGWSWTSSPGGRLWFSIDAPGFPAKGATQLHFKGTMALTFTRNEKTAEGKDVPVESGRVVTLGGVTFEIVCLPKSEGDAAAGAHREFTLRWRLPRDEEGKVAEVEVLGPDGKEIDAVSTGSGTDFNDPTMVTQEMDFRVARQHERVTIRMRYYEDVRRTGTPIDVTFGLGL